MILRTDAIEEVVICLLNEFLVKEKISDYVLQCRHCHQKLSSAI
ncbi:MAG: hypothetical protein R2942_02150 [Ignavibacteria bacterium]